MMEPHGPAFLSDAAQQAWVALARPTEAEGAVFDPASVDGLPAPVARWLRRTIAPGTPLRRGVEVSMHGEIRIGSWRPFTAQQIVGSAGYVWAARAGRFPMRVRGFDRYSTASGEMSWRLFGLIPVVTAAGSDITRSAAGRLAAEIIGLTPAGALGPAITWQGIDERRAVAAISIDGLEHQVTVEVDDAGGLRSVALPRWANPDKGPFQLHTFGVLCDGALTSGGYTVPRTVRAGWWLGTPRWDVGEFFRATIDEARFF